MDGLGIIRRLGSGYLIEQLAEALATTAEEVVATGRPGTVTLTLKISTENQGDPMVIVRETIGRKAPCRDPKGAYFFALDGDLHHDDPRQTRMEFRAVDMDSDTGEVRDVPPREREERSI